MGRKNKYETHVKSRLADIAEMIQLLNEDQIAKQLGISRRSFENYIYFISDPDGYWIEIIP